MEGSGRGGLRCTVCEHTADSLSSLQQHVLSHLSPTPHLCPHCHLSFQTPRELDTHSRTHVHTRRADTHSLIVPKHQERHTQSDPRQQETHSPGSGLQLGRQAEVEGSVPGTGSPQPPRTEQRDTEALRSTAMTGDSSPSTETEKPQPSPVQKQARPDSGLVPSPDRNLNPTSTRTPGTRARLSHAREGSEPSSPCHASSPIHHPLGPAFPLPHFLPHFPFPQDVTSSAGPQASEILAKMSELVHRRLRHGAGGGGSSTYPPMFYSPAHAPLLSKGATCFQCSISFSSLENYLVHKKHYCQGQGRWPPGAPRTPRDHPALLDKPPAPGSPKAGSGHPSDPSTLLPPPGLALAARDLCGSEGRGQEKIAPPPQTPPGPDETPSIQAEVTSPAPGGLEEGLDPLGKNSCQACKITFSRSETYLVHKQFYCATRHDSPARRSHANKVAAAQRIVRTRKRRKNADQLANQEPMPPMTHPRFLGIGPIGGATGMYQEAGDMFDNHGYPFPQPRYSMFLGVEPRNPEASLPASRSALSSRCNSPGQSELDTPNTTDTPMDLSRKQPHRQSGPGKMASMPQSAGMLERDYHECVVCKISFYRVEDYLQHKHSSCPATSTAAPNKPSTPGTRDMDSPVKSEAETTSTKLVETGLGSGSELDQVSGITAAPRLAQDRSSPPPPSKKPRRDGQITMDRSPPSTGMVARQREEAQRRQSPTEACEGLKDQPGPEDACQDTLGTLTQNGHLTDASLSPDGRQQQSESATVEMETEDNAPVNSDLTRGPGQGSAGSEPDSPGGQSASSPSSSPSSPSQSAVVCVKKGLAVANIKYCRPCDIQFNNLSNFITHKKFYCSSHTQHVK